MKTVHDFTIKKINHEKIVMITCYDFTSAAIIDQTDIDCVLVGDSLSMIIHGCTNTTGATINMMEMHTQAVARGLKNKFIISDLPFMSYRKNLNDTMNAVQALIQAGGNAVKLEGANGNLATIQHIVESGVPVMGHIGLTPQHIHSLGGFKVQGLDKTTHDDFLTQAKSLEQAGCFALVLECMPDDLASKITQDLNIPTIGIGAGLNTDGQVLVLHDLLGLQTKVKPKFLKRYLNGEKLFTDSINEFAKEVRLKKYPCAKYSYGCPPCVLKKQHYKGKTKNDKQQIATT